MDNLANLVSRGSVCVVCSVYCVVGIKADKGDGATYLHARYTQSYRDRAITEMTKYVNSNWSAICLCTCVSAPQAQMFNLQFVKMGNVRIVRWIELSPPNKWSGVN